MVKLVFYIMLLVNGMNNCMHIQKVQKELQQHQISFDIISEDYLMESKIEDNCYLINNYKYEVLIIPFVKQLPTKIIR